MNPCPCCSAPLLRHARHNSIYWFCPRCRQEMPVLEVANATIPLTNLFSKQILMSAKGPVTGYVSRRDTSTSFPHLQPT